jgi:ATP-binding cassette subfamily C (CFTR/MRP) protein 4
VAGSVPEVAAEMQTRGTVGAKVYRVYFSAGGNCMVTLLVFGVCVLSQLAISGGDYWMSYWYVYQGVAECKTLNISQIGYR